MNELDSRNMYCKIIETLDNADKDWKMKLEKVSQSKIKFEELDDNDIYEGLSFAIMSAQAKWNTIEKHENQIKHILLEFKTNQIANLSDDEVNEIYRKLRSLDNPKIASRLLKKHLFYIRNNSNKIIHLFPEPGSFKAFIGKLLPDIIKLKDMMLSPKYKMEGVQDVIFNEFAKSIGIPSIKTDTHVIRLFQRLELSKGKCDIENVANIWASNVGIELTELDNILWFFCADKYGEICTENNPKCSICCLKGEYCQWVGDLARIVARPSPPTPRISSSSHNSSPR